MKNKKYKRFAKKIHGKCLKAERLKNEIVGNGLSYDCYRCNYCELNKEYCTGLISKDCIYPGEVSLRQLEDLLKG